MFHPGARMAHAALKGEDPDFSDRPGGVIYEDDQADWIYVKDLARGIQLLQTADTLGSRIYNIGSGRATSLAETFEAVRAVIPEARATALKPGRSPAAPANPVMDISRIAADTGYEPEYDIRRGMAEYISWLRNNPQ